MNHTIIKELIHFLENSPSCFHAVSNTESILLSEGFTRLYENEKWELTKGGRYFVTRNGSSLIAFTIPENRPAGMRIAASHSDSPTFKIKENPELESDGRYIRLNTERYGGMLCAPWFDRPLSAAGRIIIKDPASRELVSRLVNIDRDLLLIPSLAIHMNREANEGYKYNAQKDMLPLRGRLCRQSLRLPEYPKQISLAMTSSCITARRQVSGALRRNSSPAGVLTTSSAHLLR